jgi:hypothetical protein
MINQTTLKKIKRKLADEGVGAKSRLAEMINAKPPTISLLLKTGYIEKSKELLILKWIKK